MGFNDRNYYRGSSGGWGSGPGGWPPVCKMIVLINVGVFLAQVMLTRPPTLDEMQHGHFGDDVEYNFVESYVEQNSQSDKNDDELRQEGKQEFQNQLADAAAMAPRVSIVQQWLQLDSDKVKQGQIWRILTSAFCHDRNGLMHILFNMLGLIWFGIALEYMYGSREFLLFYLSAAIISGLAYVGLDLWTGDSIPAIGASGAVMGVLMLYACHYPTHTIRIWFFFPLEMRWLVLLYVIFDLYPLLRSLAGDQVHTGIAHAAHLGGLAFGFFYWNQRLRLSPLIDSIQRFDWKKTFRSSRNQKPYSINDDSPASQKTEAPVAPSSEQKQVDELLIKISREGRENLTAEELEALNRASERLRSKKN